MDFKTGDRVKIVKKANGPDRMVIWVRQMDETIGMVGKIISTSGTDSVRVVLENGQDWSYMVDDLELIPSEQSVEFKIGDRVKIVQKVEKIDEYPGYGWVHAMDVTLGKVGIVSDVYDTERVAVKIKDEGTWAYSRHALEHDPPKTIKTEVPHVSTITTSPTIQTGTTQTGRYNIIVAPEKLDIERVVRENDEDGQVAFMLIEEKNCLVGIRKELVENISLSIWSPFYNHISRRFYLGSPAIKEIPGDGGPTWNWRFKVWQVSPSAIDAAKSIIESILTKASTIKITHPPKPKLSPRRKFVVRHWRKKDTSE